MNIKVRKIKVTLLSVAAVLGLSAAAPAGFPPSVKAIVLKPNATVSVAGNLDSGVKIEDLSWASNSSVACFPATQNHRFRANHVLYSVQLPPRSILNVRLVPDDRSKPMSLYGYQIGLNNFYVVPQLHSAVTCEASHLIDRPVRGKVEDGTRSMRFNATTHPYNVVIGVSGDAGVTGPYKLELSLQQ